MTVESDRPDPTGLRQYLAVRGEAEISEGGGMRLIRGLAHTYIGPGVVYPPEPDPRTGYVVRIKARKIGGIGPWA
ncbi:hypothetical protein ABT187_42820 [Streptomyces sp. NPDC001817]|uniref:hypothetical protein n=1 Tax=Streptomyces sp. NPDC001817 TaxID=3154398 RepID=UPI0033167E36